MISLGFQVGFPYVAEAPRPFTLGVRPAFFYGEWEGYAPRAAAATCAWWEASPANARGAGARGSLAARSGLPRALGARRVRPGFPRRRSGPVTREALPRMLSVNPEGEQFVLALRR